MRPNFEIVDRSKSKLTQAEKDEIHHVVEDLWIDLVQPLPEEKEKSPEDLFIIEKTNVFAREEFTELAISGEPVISPNQFHLVPEAVLRQHFPEKPSLTFAQGPNIYVSDEITGLQRCETFLHEAYHTLAVRKAAYQREGNLKKHLRHGYSLYQDEEKSDLSGYDEGITEQMAFRRVSQHAAELIAELNLTGSDALLQVDPFYETYIKVIETVMCGISEQGSLSRDELWKKVRRGYFTGEMHYLRKVDRVFGPGSMRVLAAMGADQTTLFKMSEAEKTDRIHHYFCKPEEREMLAQEILTPEEFKKYCHQKTLVQTIEPTPL